MIKLIVVFRCLSICASAMPSRDYAVSHKQENREEALRVAWLANQAGHHFWLDILNPTLNGTPLSPILTACVIEMGLLNSSHVIALITPESRPSRWIPYEYGRVKEPTVYALNCLTQPAGFIRLSILILPSSDRVVGRLAYAFFRLV